MSLWGPPSLLHNGYRGVLSPGLKRGRGVTLTTHPHLVVPRSWMSTSYTSSPPLRFHRCVVRPLYLYIDGYSAWPNMIFYCTKFHLSNMCNGSWVVFIKQNYEFLTFNRSPCSYFWVFKKKTYYKLLILLKSVRIQNFMVPRGLVQVLHLPTSRVWTSAILE
jgi:hypothetical protein